MITNTFLNIIYWLLDLLVSPIKALANVSLNSNFSNALTNSAQFLATLNKFLPIGTILQVFIAILAIEGGIVVYKLIMWALKRLPTQS